MATENVTDRAYISHFFLQICGGLERLSINCFRELSLRLSHDYIQNATLVYPVN